MFKEELKDSINNFYNTQNPEYYNGIILEINNFKTLSQHLHEHVNELINNNLFEPFGPINSEFDNRHGNFKIISNENGIINIYVQPAKKIESININITILPG